MGFIDRFMGFSDRAIVSVANNMKRNADRVA